MFINDKRNNINTLQECVATKITFSITKKFFPVFIGSLAQVSSSLKNSACLWKSVNVGISATIQLVGETNSNLKKMIIITMQTETSET